MKTLSSTFELDSNSEFKKTLTNIWQSRPTEKFEIHPKPYYPKEVLANEITFLALNPSFRRGAKVDEQPYFIDYKNNTGDRFFDKFYQINKKIGGNPWTVLDLLYIRHSNQGEIEEIYKTDVSRAFINQQVDLTLSIINEIQPKLVIVANAFVAKLLLNYHEFKKETADPVAPEFIFRYKGIPFIMEQSKFMGDRRRWDSKSEKENDRKEKMYIEINRVLAATKS